MSKWQTKQISRETALNELSHLILYCLQKLLIAFGNEWERSIITRMIWFCYISIEIMLCLFLMLITESILHISLTPNDKRCELNSATKRERIKSEQCLRCPKSYQLRAVKNCVLLWETVLQWQSVVLSCQRSQVRIPCWAGSAFWDFFTQNGAINS